MLSFFRGKPKIPTLGVVLCALYVVLLVIYGLLPGYLNNLSATFLMAANTKSLVNHGLFNFGYCINYGLEPGYPFLMGLPFIYISSALKICTGFTPQAANVLTGAIFVMLALYFGYKLIQHLGVNQYLSAFMAFVYLASYINYGQGGYHYMMYGFILLPAYIYFDLILLDSFFVTHKPLMPTIIFATVLKTFVLFMDGYSFVISSLATFVLLIFYITKHKDRASIYKAVTCFFSAYLFAVFLYKWYVPAHANYARMPIDYFRAQGVDIYSLFVPGQDLFLPSKLGIASTWNPAAFYGDGSNVRFNYLGYSLLGLGICAFFLKEVPFQIKALVVAGLLAFSLSLGPSLKINDPKPPLSKSTFTLDDYLMKKSDATLDLHTEFIYKKVPGVSMMRAVHRWLLLFKLCVIILAAISLTHLVNRKHPYLAFGLLCLVIIETMPDIPQLQAIYANNYDMKRGFDLTVIKEARDTIPKGSKIVFISNENDFLGNYISAKADAKAYNCGGDKNQAIAMSSWPKTILEITRHNDLNENSYLALSKNLADIVILPHFNLRWDSYNWPPQEKQGWQDIEKSIKYDDPRLRFNKTNWFTLITLNHSKVKAYETDYTNSLL